MGLGVAIDDDGIAAGIDGSGGRDAVLRVAFTRERKLVAVSEVCLHAGVEAVVFYIICGQGILRCAGICVVVRFFHIGKRDVCGAGLSDVYYRCAVQRGRILVLEISRTESHRKRYHIPFFEILRLLGNDLCFRDRLDRLGVDSQIIAFFLICSSPAESGHIPLILHTLDV